MKKHDLCIFSYRVFIGFRAKSSVFILLMKNVPTKYFIPRSTEWRWYPDAGDAKEVVGDLVHGEAAQGFPRRSMHSIIKKQTNFAY
jgi:hypothetical protein